MSIGDFGFQAKARHKVFLSFYHDDDEPYRESFVRQFSRLYTSKSVKPGDIDTDVSTEYIKRLIRENYIADASVVVTLVGPNTKYRKHVDWEISAGLEPSSGRSGLVGILLPEFPLLRNGNYMPDNLPPRLWDNVDTGFAEVWTWSDINGRPGALRSIVNSAFDRRHDDTATNGRLQMYRNTGP